MRSVLVGVFVFCSLPALADLGDFHCVTADSLVTGLEVKIEPSESAETVMVIGAGRSMIEFGEENGWLWVGVSRAGGREGYVPIDMVARVDLDGLPCGS